MKNKPTAILKDWDIFWGILYGDVYGDNKYDDGDNIKVTSIVNITKESDHFIVETRNIIYKCMFKDASYNLSAFNSIDEIYEQLKDTIDK